MKKTLLTWVSILMILVVGTTVATAENTDPGGFKGFLTGCFFGLRVGTDYNDQGTGDRDFVSWFLVGCCFGPRAQMDYSHDKDIHWREICRLIPFVGGVFAIWDGIEIADEKGRDDLQSKYGTTYY